VQSPFSISILIYGSSSSPPSIVNASWVSSLSITNPSVPGVVVLFGGDGDSIPGLYIWANNRWTFCLPYDVISKFIVFGGQISVYVNLTEEIEIDPSVAIYRNGVQSSSLNLTPDPVIWVTVSVTPPGSYVLPPATDYTLGGIKVGDNLTITGDGTLSAIDQSTESYTLPPATTSTLGGVIIGENLSVSAGGIISGPTPTPEYVLPPATVTTLGGVIVGNNLTVEANGTLNAIDQSTEPYVLPPATSTILGGIKVGENLTVEADGTLNASGSTAEYILPPATVTTLGGVIIGQNLTVEPNGTLNAIDQSTEPYVLPPATVTTLGGVIVGENLTVEADGTLNAIDQATEPYVLPPATTSSLGGIIAGANLTVDSDGTLNALATGNVDGTALGATTPLLNVTINPANFLGWGTNTYLYGDAPNTLEQYNGTNPQIYQLYNTFTDINNYERGYVRWVANSFRIGTENAGTGIARGLYFQTQGINRWAITTGGSLNPGADNTYSVGTSALRISKVYAVSGVSVVALDNTTHSSTGIVGVNTLVTISIPGGSFTANGALKIIVMWNCTNNANIKTITLTYGGSTFLSQALGAVAGSQSITIIRNNGVTNSQTGFGASASSQFSSTGAVPVNTTIDTTVAQNLTLSATLTVTTDVVSVNSIIVESINL